MMRTVTRVLSGVCVTLVLMAGPARAATEPQPGRGAAMGAGTIRVDEPLHAATRYSLGVVRVWNPARLTSRYHMSLEVISGRTAPPAAWVRFEPEQFTLATGESRTVRITMQVPAGARAGNYEALLSATAGDPDAPDSGARVGVAAAARLLFTVTAASAASSPTGPGSDLILPVLAGVLSLSVLLALGRVAAGRYRISIEHR
jgi:hypothetical protein